MRAGDRFPSRVTSRAGTVSNMPQLIRIAVATVVVALLPGIPQVARAAAPQTEDVPVQVHAYSLARAKQVIGRKVIGRSVQGRSIMAFRKGNPDAITKVVVVGQMHGDEKGGVMTARYIRDRLPVDSDVDLWIVPTMNPDGFVRNTRRNAHGVDLNRNFPTNGWTRTSPGSITYSGPSRASEPETRAMVDFLGEVEPRFITSIHQPYGSVGRNDKDPGFFRRLSRYLSLPLETITIGPSTGPNVVAPSMTSWYNHNVAFTGSSVTVEYTRDPSLAFKTVKAGNAILKASLADW